MAKNSLAAAREGWGFPRAKADRLKGGFFGPSLFRGTITPRLVFRHGQNSLATSLRTTAAEPSISDVARGDGSRPAAERPDGRRMSSQVIAPSRLFVPPAALFCLRGDRNAVFQGLACMKPIQADSGFRSCTRPSRLAVNRS